MNIGIDIDGVLIETQKIRIREALEYAKKNNINMNIDYSKDDTNGLFDWDEKTDLDFFEKYFEDYYLNSPVTDNAIEVIKELKELGHKIFFITARSSDKREIKVIGAEKIKDVTIKWFSKNNITQGEIVFVTSGSKSKTCLEKNIDVLIDDSMKNIIEVSKVIPVITYNTKYNKESYNIKSNYKIYNANDWKEIKVILNNYFKVDFL